MQKTSFMLFLNKFDIFEKKVSKVSGTSTKKKKKNFNFWSEIVELIC